MYTSQAVKVNFRNYGEIVVPQGIKLTHKTASGEDKKYHFVDEFSWIDTSYPDYANILKMDAKSYGINIPKEYVTYDITTPIASDRILKMVESWKNEGIAFSKVENMSKDGLFFELIGVNSSAVGTTSQYGLDVVYYNTEWYNNDTDALRRNRILKD